MRRQCRCRLTCAQGHWPAPGCMSWRRWPGREWYPNSGCCGDHRSWVRRTADLCFSRQSDLLSRELRRPGADGLWKGAGDDRARAVSHRESGRAQHLLSRGWRERRAGHFALARAPLVVADVRAVADAPRRPVPFDRARLSGLWTQRLAERRPSSRTRSIIWQLSSIVSPTRSGLRGTRSTCRTTAVRSVFAWRWPIPSACRHSSFKTPSHMTRGLDRIGRRAARSGPIGPHTRVPCALNLLSFDDDADAARGRRSARRTIRPRSLDRRILLPQPAGTGRHPDRTVLRLPHERRLVPKVAGLAAKDTAQDARRLGQVRQIVHNFGARGLSPRCAKGGRSRTRRGPFCSGYSRRRNRVPRGRFSRRESSRSL